MTATISKITNDVVRKHVVAMATERGTKAAAQHFADRGRVFAIGTRYLENEPWTCEACVEADANDWFDETGKSYEWLETYVEAYMEAAFAWGRSN